MQGSIILPPSFTRASESQVYREINEAFDRLGYHFEKKHKYKQLAQKRNRIPRQLA
ncbi:MAG: hypothetical protein OFPII_09880 [Osedax symbiont Rs1]|nr:MAG: hypothetical protein OFPII_09880 [Osedax symbiont Rs1]